MVIVRPADGWHLIPPPFAGRFCTDSLLVYTLLLAFPEIHRLD